MSNKHNRGGLGRGLGALIPTAPPAPAQPTTPSHPARFGSSTDRDADAPVAPDAVGAVADGAANSAANRAAEAPDADTHPGVGHSDSTESDTDLSPVPGAAFAELAIASIHANAKQPRQVFDEDALDELTHSIREFGVLQPVVVRPDPPADGPDGAAGSAGYELVMGERRLRAAQAAGLQTIPAIVRSTADDAMLRDALLENIHRAQLNPLEEAAAYQQLLEEFGTTHDELAHRIGRSRPQVSNTIRLLNLPLAVQRRVAAGVLSAGHARALLGLDDHDQQDELAARIVAEGLSVRATEELVTMARRAGEERKPARKAAARTFTAPAVTELAGKLSDVFDTRVRVDLGRRKGRITVEFASIDDLERIVGLMAPEVRAAAQRPGTPAPGAPGEAAPAVTSDQNRP